MILVKTDISYRLNTVQTTHLKLWSSGNRLHGNVKMK